MRSALFLAASLSLTPLATPGFADPGDRVAWPDDYATAFVRYATVDKPDRTPPIVRFLYVDPESLAAARSGLPLPEGAIVVMEDHAAALVGDGQAVRSAAGRLVPTPEITNLFVQEKRAGWGASVPDALRNGDWDYAWFAPDGSRKVGRDGTLDACFACHKEQAAATDFTFTTAPFVARIKGVE